MHEPRPYGLHVIDGKLTENDEAFINITAKQFTNQKQVNNLDNSKQVYDLPDGGYAIFQDMGGNFRIIAHKKAKKEVWEYGLASDYIPMMYSGLITKAVVRPDEGVEIILTEQTRLRINNYRKDNLPRKKVKLTKFIIEYASRFNEFIPQEWGEMVYTQYDKLRPTWYSGAMSEIIQIIAGYGKQNFKVDKNAAFADIENASFFLPDDVKIKIEEEIKGIRLPVYTGIPNVDGQIFYDYKHYRTNAVGFGEDKKPWLLQINRKGVYVMPLPIIPATATKAFKDYISEKDDQELLKILNKFGGMPSGEIFPINEEDFFAWVRAGAIIKLCDSDKFYEYIAYSSACGWATNLLGTEGFNTCYGYDSNGIGIGYTFKLKINLAKIFNEGKLYNQEQTLDVERQEKLDQYMAGLLGELDGRQHKARAIMYKLDRIGKMAIYQRALEVNFDASKDVTYWENLEIKPLANHNGVMTKVAQGYLYHPNGPKAQPQIKFPEPSFNGCLSFDFSPTGEHPDKKPSCDTIMFAYYVGNDLKVVKYFTDWGQYIIEGENNFEPYMTTGDFFQTENEGWSKFQGNFYTTDFDDREQIAPLVKKTSIKGADKGYDSKPFFEFFDFFSMTGSLWRNRYYTHLTKIKEEKNRNLDIAVAIPFFCRNVVLHAKKEFIKELIDSETLGLYAVEDPTTYIYWTYDKVFAWRGSGGLTKPAKGTPYPVDGNPVWVEEKQYNPSPASEFADNGDWILGLPADYTWLIHPDANNWQQSGGGGAPKVNTYQLSSKIQNQEKGRLQISIDTNPNLINEHVPSSDYYRLSPEDEFIFYRDASQIVFGERQYSNISETTEDGKRKYWGFTTLADHQSAHNFIGVINE